MSRPNSFSPREIDPVPSVQGGWVGISPGMDWCEMSRLHRDSICVIAAGGTEDTGS